MIINSSIDPFKCGPDGFIDLVFREMDWGGGGGDQFRDSARLELADSANPEDEENDDLIEEKAREIATREISDNYYFATYNLERLGDPMNLWRSITVPSNLDLETMCHAINLSEIGVCWSWDEKSASAHFGKFGNNYEEIVLHAMVPRKYADWKTTLLFNITPHSMEEREVRLISGSPIRIDMVKRKKTGRWNIVNLAGQA